MSLADYTNSSEFKRASSNAADGALKMLFKGIGIAIAALANFAKEAVMSILGK